MTQEIVDAVKVLEQEKGISADTLMDALADALLSRIARARICQVRQGRPRPRDRGLPGLRTDPARGAREAPRRGDRRPGAHHRPGDGRAARARGAGTRSRDAGPLRGPDRDQGRNPRGLRPHCQTAKQVIYQRIREAERQMMYDEYRDRVGEPSHRTHPAVGQALHAGPAPRTRRALPKSEQVYSERYDHGMRVKAVITDVSESTRARASSSPPQPRTDQGPLRTRVPEIADKLVEIVRCRPRAGLPLEDRRRLPRRRRRPGRRLRRPARLQGAHGRV